MIHQYKLNGYNIVIDTYSGSVHAVDEVAYDIIELYEKNERETIVDTLVQKYAHLDLSREEIEDCIKDIEYLKEAGQLFSDDIYQNAVLKMKSGSVIKAMCLHVAHTCNLACDYCFAKQGKYHGKDGLMSFEVGKKALDFLIEHSGTRTNLEMDFFGGEPLMNWEVVKQLVAYGRSQEKEKKKKFRFTLTTNGVLLDDEIIEFANKEMYNVVLSLDGRKEIHDRFRKNLAGKGSYDFIFSTDVFMYLNPTRIQSIITNIKQQTHLNGYNLIVSALNAANHGRPLMPLPFTFIEGELKDYYKDWKIISYSENITASPYPYAMILAQKVSE